MKRHNVLKNIAAAALAATGLTGCISVLPEPEAPSFLVRAPEMSDGLLSGRLETKVVVNNPEGAGALSGAEIAAANQDGLVYINRVRWADSPSRMLQQQLIDSLATVDGDGWASTVKSGARSDFELRWTIRDLSYDMVARQGVCDLRLTLLTTASRDIVALDRVRAVVDAPYASSDGERARAVAEALSIAAARTGQFILDNATADHAPDPSRFGRRPQGARASVLSDAFGQDGNGTQPNAVDRD